MGFLRIIASIACLVFWAASASADEVRMTFGISLPPHVLADQDSGIEVDIAREALALAGHELVPIYVPPRRIAHELLGGFVDAASKDQGRPITEPGFFYANEAFFFHDVAFSLAENGHVLRQPSDLDGLEVVTFQNALKHYPEWLAPVAEDGRYSEVVDQALQVKMLQRGRADEIIADENIIAYHMRELEKQTGQPLRPVVKAYINPKIGYAPIFRSEALRDAFNAGLAELRASGRYDAILATYSKGTN